MPTDSSPIQSVNLIRRQDEDGQDTYFVTLRGGVSGYVITDAVGNITLTPFIAVVTAEVQRQIRRIAS